VWITFFYQYVVPDGTFFTVTQVVLFGKSGEKQVLHPTLVQKILAETKIKNYICIVKLRV